MMKATPPSSKSEATATEVRRCSTETSSPVLSPDTSIAEMNAATEKRKEPRMKSSSWPDGVPGGAGGVSRRCVKQGV